MDGESDTRGARVRVELPNSVSDDSSFVSEPSNTSAHEPATSIMLPEGKGEGQPSVTGCSRARVYYYSRCRPCCNELAGEIHMQNTADLYSEGVFQVLNVYLKLNQPAVRHKCEIKHNNWENDICAALLERLIETVNTVNTSC